MAASKQEVKEDVWIPTVCGGCYACCHVRVRRVNGVAVQIEGEPETSQGARGGLCGKGIAQLQILYDPNRLNYPLRRTNPEKGLGVDPKWKRISWEEAYSEINEKVSEARKSNPLKIAEIFGPNAGLSHTIALMGFLVSSYGSHNIFGGGAGSHCGNAPHLLAGMNHCSWSILPDFKYCNYAIHFGATKGTGAGHTAAACMRQAAEARSRGMKTVVFDPVCNHPGAKAHNWIPIIPGTDGAVALSMANLLVNELKIYDTEYLEKKTNAPYLVQLNGKYARNDEGEPLLWDAGDNRPKAWNEPTLKRAAMEGSYEVNGLGCKPAFVLLREHLKQYTPEWAEGISSVPAETIRRVAQEFGENARIGATITIEGIELPYRPVACIIFRGGAGHSNGFQSYVSVDLLNHLVGACEVPGGCIGWGGKCDGKKVGINMDYEPVTAMDGFLKASSWPVILPGTWPHDPPKAPYRLDLGDLFTMCAIPPFPVMKHIEEIWQKFPLLKYRFEVLFTIASNVALSSNVERTAEMLSRIPFHVDINIYPSETNEGFADIVLPDACWLESYEPFTTETFHFLAPTGMEDFAYRQRQPVVQPMYERKTVIEMCEELAKRAGTSRMYHAMLNYHLSTTSGESTFKPETEVFLPVERFMDTYVKARFGPERGLDWLLREQDNTFQWKKSPEETYWRWFVPARSSICYNEFVIEQKENLENVLSSAGIPMPVDWWEQYTPLPSYFLTSPLKSQDSKYDLVLITSRDVLHSGTSSGYIPWIVECTQMDPFSMKVAMNCKVAEEKGLKDGDLVWIENDRGSRTTGMLRAIEGIHPEVLCITAFGGGRLVRGSPIPKGVGGVLANQIIPAEFPRDLCPVSNNPETSAKVRVYKFEKQGEELR